MKEKVGIRTYLDQGLMMWTNRSGVGWSRSSYLDQECLKMHLGPNTQLTVTEMCVPQTHVVAG